MRRIVLGLVSAGLLVFIITGYMESNAFNRKHKIAADSTVTISISAIGDLMCHSPQYDYARVGADSFDFNPSFEIIRPYLQNSDFTFGNLETVTAGRDKGYSGYPLFNVPDEFIAAVKYAGINLVTTSNNHAFDRGEFGVLRTISEINKYGIKYTGTFVSQHDRDSIRIFNIKGIKLALLAYTFGTNGNPVPKSKPYLINLIDTVLIKNDILSARKENADIVLVYFHFGTEYKRFPTSYQKTIVANAIANGADIIIGGHPHVIEPAEFYKTNNGRLDSGFVAYSLGNFISNQRWRYSDAGVVLNIGIKKNFTSGAMSISNVSYLPTWVFKGRVNNKNEYKIIPADDTANAVLSKSLTAGDRGKMLQAYEDTKYIMTKYTNKVSIETIAK